jgi:hypothetical protein
VVAALEQRRPVLVACGATTVGAGWVAFTTLSEELGLLLVLIGAGALVVTLLGVRRKPTASPLDGPMFGETEGS